jgi:hypothetical protein
VKIKLSSKEKIIFGILIEYAKTGKIINYNELVEFANKDARFRNTKLSEGKSINDKIDNITFYCNQVNALSFQQLLNQKKKILILKSAKH